MIDWNFVITFIVAFSIYEIGKSILKETRYIYKRYMWKYDPLYGALLKVKKEDLDV